MGQEGNPIVAIQRDDNLAVAVALEVVFFVKLGTIMLVVVQLPIYDSVNVLLAVMERLVS